MLCARHALAIDDERDAFHPLLWDEVHEEELRQSKRVEPGRLEQVWFTGMHADVGGGYSDESLSYVSLLWMMEEAERCGVRTLTVIKDRFVALASSLGPLHDSRAGMGAYYRYQPRKIAAWLHPVDSQTLSLRDPAITDSRGKSRGLLRSVTVHESVINRIATGTDRYAPITLPKRSRSSRRKWPGRMCRRPTIKHPSTSGRAHSQIHARSCPCVRAMRISGCEYSRAAMESRVEPRLVAADCLFRDPRGHAVSPEPATIAGRLPTPPVLADGRTWIGGVIRLLAVVLPAFVGQIGSTCMRTIRFYFLLLAGLIRLLMSSSGRRIERRLRDNARRVWRLALEGDGLEPRGDAPADIQEQPAGISASFSDSRGTSCRTGLSRR